MQIQLSLSLSVSVRVQEMWDSLVQVMQSADATRAVEKKTSAVVVCVRERVRVVLVSLACVCSVLFVIMETLSYVSPLLVSEHRSVCSALVVPQVSPVLWVCALLQ